LGRRGRRLQAHHRRGAGPRYRRSPIRPRQAPGGFDPPALGAARDCASSAKEAPWR
jgi:hypothetical protein